MEYATILGLDHLPTNSCTIKWNMKHLKEYHKLTMMHVIDQTYEQIVHKNKILTLRGYP